MKRRFPVETNLDYTDVKSQNLRNIILVYLPVNKQELYCAGSEI